MHPACPLLLAHIFGIIYFHPPFSNFLTTCLPLSFSHPHHTTHTNVRSVSSVTKPKPLTPSEQGNMIKLGYVHAAQQNWQRILKSVRLFLSSPSKKPLIEKRQWIKQPLNTMKEGWSFMCFHLSSLFTKKVYVWKIILMKQLLLSVIFWCFALFRKLK